jgi:hypothetical protein
MELEKDRVIVASDVQRDGIGIEVYRNNESVIEILRSDSEKTRTIRTFKKNVSLELMEQSITKFKKETPWEFISE